MLYFVQDFIKVARSLSTESGYSRDIRAATATAAARKSILHRLFQQSIFPIPSLPAALTAQQPLAPLYQFAIETALPQ